MSLKFLLAGLLCLSALPGYAAAPRIATFSEKASGLDRPRALAPVADGRLFIAEQSGKIRVFEGGKLLPDPWMELETGFDPVTDSGLLGLCADPDFGSTGFLFAASTYKEGEDTFLRLVRLREVDGKGTLSRVLYDGIPAGKIHNGGRVKVGPDGKVYWTVGDGGNEKAAQDAANLAGKILRLEPDGRLPADNPVPGSPVWALGFQNPLGLTWDPLTERLYATDIGPVTKRGGTKDEINLVQAGKNYGWPLISGSEGARGLEAPMVQSTIARNWDPGSCQFIRGGRWNGSLLFAGLNGQTLYRMTINPKDPGKMTFFEELFQEDLGRLREIVQGPDGTLWLVTANSDAGGTPPPNGDRLLVVKP